MGNITRRAFIRGSTICLTTLGGLRLGLGMKKARASWIGNRFVVYVFLRGGMDGLNLVAPISGPDRDPYVTKRPTIYLRTTGDTAALPLSGDFGLHFAVTAVSGDCRCGEVLRKFLNLFVGQSGVGFADRQ